MNVISSTQSVVSIGTADRITTSTDSISSAGIDQNKSYALTIKKAVRLLAFPIVEAGLTYDICSQNLVIYSTQMQTFLRELQATSKIILTKLIVFYSILLRAMRSPLTAVNDFSLPSFKLSSKIFSLTKAGSFEIFRHSLPAKTCSSGCCKKACQMTADQVEYNTLNMRQMRAANCNSNR